MEIVANFSDGTADPTGWAQQRERDGFDVLAASDHFWVNHPFPHLWVTLTQLAAATSSVRITSSFSNNLFRSPVEFAQASLTLQRASGGRFEAGLGAGWSASEVTGAGLRYPPPSERARHYREAVLIVRELFETGQCRFQGDHYRVDVPMIGPHVPPPPLVASVGGPWTIRHVTPLVDRVEIMLAAAATRGGSLDLAELGAVEEHDVRRVVEAVRDVRADIPIGAFVLVGAVEHPRIRSIREALGGAFLARFFGEPGAIADAVWSLADLGFARVQLTELSPGTLESLGPALYGHAVKGDR